MAAGRHFRNEKRMPSFYVMATIVVFVALCLIGMWVLSSPSGEEVVSKAESTTLSERERSQEKESEPQQFEESTGNVEQETEEKVEESPDTQEKKEDKEYPELEIKEKEEKEPEKEEKEPETGKEQSTLDTQEEREGDKNGGKEAEKPPQEEDIPQKEPELEESGGAQSEIQIESKELTNTWETQASESREEKEKVEGEEQNPEEGTGSEEKPKSEEEGEKQKGSEASSDSAGEWVLCEAEGATDYIPCLDNKEAIKNLPSTKHYEHRERHCPSSPPTCLVPLPEGYRSPIPWPKSRNEVWYSNVPHPGLVSYKKDQNWVKKSGDKLIFPGGGTQFKHGALHYIEFIEQILPDIAWGNHTRVILDVGCGVASFGGYLFDKDVLAMSFAPKDEHEAQIQLALERGIPAISAVMGTQRLLFPSNVFDVVHCARCRVPWHIEGGKLLLELNRVLRPGGYFVWSATPVYWKGEEDVGIWKEMVALTAAICWELLARTTDPSTGVGVAIFHKPTTNFCYENRKQTSPPLCDGDDKPDAAWYIPMTACIHKIPTEEDARGIEWPQEWPLRLTTAPTWLSGEKGLYGKPAAADFRSDTEHWQRVVEKSYIHGLGIDWNSIRNVMDMKAVYGGFAAALASQPVWVMNVVPYDAADTLPIIFDRGLFGIYHDWCESFSSYPRTYDLLHSDHLFDKLKKRCSIKAVVVEIDRLLRPEGWVIFREKVDNVKEIEDLIKSLNWNVRMTYMKGQEGLLAVQKTRWRPEATS
eukprot:c23115_g2_i1 orf=561-2834(-)